MKSSLFVLSALLALAGCRRANIREITLEIPGLPAATATEADRGKILAALTAYEGVKTNKVVWGSVQMAAANGTVTNTATTLTIRFDSMQVAEMNLRKAIEKAGFAVVYPTLEKGAPAGYINERKDEVRD